MVLPSKGIDGDWGSVWANRMGEFENGKDRLNCAVGGAGRGGCGCG